MIKNIKNYSNSFSIAEIIKNVNYFLSRTKLLNEADNSSIIHTILKYSFDYAEKYLVQKKNIHNVLLYTVSEFAI